MTFLGCEHCGTVVRPAEQKGQEACVECGRTLRRVSFVEARDLALEKRIAEQFRTRARSRSGRAR